MVDLFVLYAKATGTLQHTFMIAEGDKDRAWLINSYVQVTLSTNIPGVSFTIGPYYIIPFSPKGFFGTHASDDIFEVETKTGKHFMWDMSSLMRLAGGSKTAPCVEGLEGVLGDSHAVQCSVA